MKKKRPDAAKHSIYQQIRTEIITNRKKPGERLSIDMLKTQFGTSVTPVREALQMLSQEDLVTIKPRSGYYVTRITLKQLNDMLDLRSILELAAVERAAEKITDQQIAHLEKIHAGYTNDEDDAYARYTLENKNFHTGIAEASGNRELALQIAHIHDRLARFVVLSKTGKNMIPTHGILIERLKVHDGPGALKTMHKELNDGKRLIMERIMLEEADFWHLGASTLPHV